MVQTIGSVMTESASSGSAIAIPSVLDRGDHLVELALSRPVRSAEILEKAMATLGWSRVVVEETGKEILPAEEWGLPGQDVDKIFHEPPHLYRFLGRLDVPIAPQDGTDLVWLYAARVGIDVFAELRRTHVPFELRQGKSYEIRFTARRKAQPTRAATIADLREMGFAIDKLVCLKRDMRFPGNPGAQNALWYGRVQWTKPDSYVSMEDDFFFEDVEER